MDCSTAAFFHSDSQSIFLCPSGCLTAALRPLTKDTPSASWSRNSPSVVLVERLRLPTGESCSFLPANLRMSSHFAPAISVPRLTAPRLRSNHKPSVAHQSFPPPHLTGDTPRRQADIAVRWLAVKSQLFEGFILQHAVTHRDVLPQERWPPVADLNIPALRILLTAAHYLGRHEVRTSRD